MDNKLVTLAEALVCRANLMARRCEGSEESELFRQLAIHLSASLLATREACKERDALTAENSALKTAVSEFNELYGIGLGVSNWHQNGDIEPLDNFFDENDWSPETPATDAAIANIQAQGVDMAINHLTNKLEGTGQIGVPVMALEWLAAELRKDPTHD